MSNIAFLQAASIQCAVLTRGEIADEKSLPISRHSEENCVKHDKNFNIRTTNVT